jgi:hypothetical protein
MFDRSELEIDLCQDLDCHENLVAAKISTIKVTISDG